LFSVLLSANRLQLAFEVEKILENRLTQKIWWIGFCSKLDRSLRPKFSWRPHYSISQITYCYIES
jgi:hypothetical protein